MNFWIIFIYKFYAILCFVFLLLLLLFWIVAIRCRNFRYYFKIDCVSVREIVAMQIVDKQCKYCKQFRSTVFVRLEPSRAERSTGGGVMTETRVQMNVYKPNIDIEECTLHFIRKIVNWIPYRNQKCARKLVEFFMETLNTHSFSEHYVWFVGSICVVLGVSLEFQNTTLFFSLVHD